MLPSKKLRWAAGVVVVLLVAHIGIAPRRSDDLRVALTSECPVARGALESGAIAVDAAVAFGQAVTAASIQTAARLAKAYGQPHSSRPLEAATSEHFHVLSNRGELLVNRQVWGCLVVAVKDLRAPARSPGSVEAARDPYVGERVFLEARIVHSADGGAFEIQPLTLRFRGAAEPSLLGSSARDLRFDVTLAVPGAKGPFARTVLDFSALVPSTETELGVGALGSMLAKRSGWLAGPQVGAGLQKQIDTFKAQPTTEARRLSAQTPTTVRVSLVETREASVLWRYLGDVLEAFTPPAGEAVALRPPRPPSETL